MTVCLNDHCQKLFQKLFDYVKKNNYEGNDLFDGLNSILFKNTFLYKSRFFRLALIQFCKLSPINFRKIFLVPKGFNPKAGALFLLGNLNMFKVTSDEKYKIEAEKLFQRLKDCSVKREKGLAWGYNFDWQARAFFVPTGTPNMVTSVYVGKTLLRYNQFFGNSEALSLAKQILEFILNEMIIFETDNSLCFRYIPQENAHVHNANLLAASFLSEINNYLNSNEVKNKIIKSVNFSLSDIKENGAWAYGTKSFHRWVDNFHTAFNIESLIEIQANLDINDYNEVLKKVIKYYLNNLFTENGTPKYYDNEVFPIDIHVLAEVLIVLEKIEKLSSNTDLAKINIIREKTLNLIFQFQDKRGFFYFRKNKHFWNKISYIRWAQAWMFYALSFANLYKMPSGMGFEKEKTENY